MGNCIKSEVYDELPAYGPTSIAYGPTAYGPPPPYNLTINLETKPSAAEVKQSAAEVKPSAAEVKASDDTDSVYAIYCLFKSGVVTHGPHKFTLAQMINWCQIRNSEKSVDEQYYFYARQSAAYQYSQNDEFAFAVYERKHEEVIPHPHVYTRAEAEMFCRRANDFVRLPGSSFFVVRQPMHVSCAALNCPCGAKQYQKCKKICL